MELKLQYGFDFAALHDRQKLHELDLQFAEFLKKTDENTAEKYEKARANPDALADKEHSLLLIEIAPLLEQFIAEFFNIKDKNERLRARHDRLSGLYQVKRFFVQRAANKRAKPEDVEGMDEARADQILAKLELNFSDENFALEYADKVNDWQLEATKYEHELDLAAAYAVWSLHNPAGQKRHKHSVLFSKPKKLDFDNLVDTNDIEQRDRRGFGLTEDRPKLPVVLAETNYCIYCHNQEKDSCSKGLKDKDNTFKTSPTNVPLTGCPLEEKVSEMNILKNAGYSIAALAVAIIDNPMIAGTGHRICNDCMKSCIYQKQSPVDIPKIETGTLQDVLDLTWGFEVYSLLTKWNPLNLLRPLPKNNSGHNILVVGLGPAGFTLSHHLLQDGHNITAIDGLKIEPLDEQIKNTPQGYVEKLFENLDSRKTTGFGGVAEYGITSRWNKNYLTLIRLLLERRESYQYFSGVRLGSNITIKQAFAAGFDHIALCMGAGKPNIISAKHMLAGGVKTASDFLMNLQLGGAFKKDSLSNLQISLPVAVIGGGLTAVDTATEAAAYYPVQVLKFYDRYQKLCTKLGKEIVEQNWSDNDKKIATEFIRHAEELLANPKTPRSDLIKKWGGVKIAYRKHLQDSPAYRLNHEELEKALEEGIEFLENRTPKEILTDKSNTTVGVKFAYQTLPAKTVIIAAGTSPYTSIADEDDRIELNGKYFAIKDKEGNIYNPEHSAKPDKTSVLTHFESDGRAVSFFGDMHPDFAGNVVKAMASAKYGHKEISKVLKLTPPKTSWQNIKNFCHDNLIATVAKIQELAPKIIEVIVKAPLAARNFKPGQFYRLQNFENIAGTNKTMEGLALTGAWSDPKSGLISLIILEMGGSSDLCRRLKTGEPIILMGPTGTPTEIPQNQTVLLAGGGLGNAVLFSIGKAMRENGCRVLYFAGYRKNHDRYKIEQIEQASDSTIWCCDEPSDFTANRPQDKVFTGNMVEAMLAYHEGKLGEKSIAMQDIERVIAIGSDHMMAAIKQARHSALKEVLPSKHIAIASINSPMQCMMKEICAQCLQRHTDPETGTESFVYSCKNQDQCMEKVDFDFLNTRLSMNSLSEKLTATWLAQAVP